jgi:HK97 family phage prohead protease
MELRLSPLSIEANDDGTMTVSGYVNKTDQWSNLLGRQDRFKEKIASGAFQRAIDKADEIHFLAEHDNSKILASTRNSSLELREDGQGLFMSATICPTSWGKDYYQLIKSGILQNMSFGFRAIKDAWKKVDGYFERTVNELELFEVSVVRDPAYSQSTISARGIDLVEDVEIPIEQPTIQIGEITIRSEEDLQVLADKIFAKLYEQLQLVKAPEQEKSVEEPIIEDVVEEDTVEEPVDELTVEDNQEVTDSKEVIEEVVDEQPDEQPEEVVDEPVIEDAQQSAAEKIRDFINKFKDN